MTVARKPGHRGERGVSRNPPRRESRIASAEPVCSCAHFFVHLAHETAGAARTRHSLLPLLERDRRSVKPRAIHVARRQAHVRFGRLVTNFTTSLRGTLATKES